MPFHDRLVLLQTVLHLVFLFPRFHESASVGRLVGQLLPFRFLFNFLELLQREAFLGDVTALGFAAKVLILCEQVLADVLVLH